jgi:hypothetical protein
MMMLVLKHVASRVKRARTHTFAVVWSIWKKTEEKKAKKSTPKNQRSWGAKKIKVNG